MTRNMSEDHHDPACASFPILILIVRALVWKWRGGEGGGGSLHLCVCSHNMHLLPTNTDTYSARDITHTHKTLFHPILQYSAVQ